MFQPALVPRYNRQQVERSNPALPITQLVRQREGLLPKLDGAGIVTLPMHLDEADVRAVLRWDELIVAMERALAAFSAGQVLQPVRNMLTIEEGKRSAPSNHQTR